MPLVSMGPMLRAARAGGYGVGAFNIVDYTSFKAVVEAADELDAPVIAQVSVKTVKLWGYRAIAAWARQLAGATTVPVALHVDHCRDLDVIRACIEAGWTSVMFDGSHLPFADNLAATREVVGLAKPHGIAVEAELGAIGGVEDDIAVADEDARLADPEEAARFCHGLELDVFAPAIGTAHGVYKGEPRLAFDRIDRIANETGVPLALHGGTGLADDVFRRCIALGCAKVNISTQIKYAFVEGFAAFHATGPKVEPVLYLDAQLARLRREVAADIELFGAAGKAHAAVEV